MCLTQLQKGKLRHRGVAQREPGQIQLQLFQRSTKEVWGVCPSSMDGMDFNLWTSVCEGTEEMKKVGKMDECLFGVQNLAKSTVTWKVSCPTVLHWVLYKNIPNLSMKRSQLDVLHSGVFLGCVSKARAF